MVIEMSFNSDIEKKIQENLHFQKEINVFMYINELKKNVNLNHFIWTKFQ